jgi:hypothetical protein
MADRDIEQLVDGMYYRSEYAGGATWAPLRAITVRQPWAGMIFGYDRGTDMSEFLGMYVDPRKPIENRPWKTPYRGPLLIHAGTQVDEGFLRSEVLTDHPSGQLGVVLGVVHLVAICPDDRQCGHELTWGWEGQYHWILENPRLFDGPIPYRGRQSIYTITEPDVIAEITRQLGGTK